MVLPDAAFSGVEAGVTVKFLLKYAKFLVGQLTEEELFGKSGVAGVLASVLDSGHTAVELVARNAKCGAEPDSIEPPFRLVHHHHNVVCRLVIHH